jgi:hypothetical protein
MKCYSQGVQPASTAKSAPPATKPTAKDKPREQLEGLQVLSIVIGGALTPTLVTYFEKWFGFSDPLAFALGVFSAWTVAWLVYRPKRLWLGKWIRSTTPRFFLALAAFALVAYLSLRIFHFSTH